QDANNRVADSCTVNVSPSALEFTATNVGRSKTVSVTSTTEYVYDSGARSTAYTMPNATITGSQSSQFNIVAPSVPRVPLTYTINCPTYYADGRGLPIAYAVFTSSDCPNVSGVVDLSFSGNSSVILPTLNGTFGNAGNYWYISINSFDILGATPNVTWTSNVAYDATIEGAHYSGQFIFTAKTSSTNQIQYLGMSGDSHMSYSYESGANTIVFRHDATIATTAVPTGRLDVGQPQQSS
ncbi:hypothetical protein, partial [Methanosphaera sp.]|uniref:hypothetical protein n=1 Tax=Methanosphaera sp. TaxID=2666342 RepID=UPI0025EE82B8